ncbi:hypothetical protein G9A89_005109 [Geosiphon pyriformis]|nr:hypothetical protein G9A89_005109 [Geosiphon pyriformis]
MDTINTSVKELLPIKRPGKGKNGRPVKVLVNYFEIKKRPKAPFFKYAVEIKRPYIEAEGSELVARRQPKSLPLELKAKVFKELEKKKGHEWFAGVKYYFDGENTLYSTTPIKAKSNYVVTSVILSDDQDSSGEPNEFQVGIVKLQDQLDLTELDTYIQGKEFQWDHLNMESLKAFNDLVHNDPASRYFRFRDSILDPQTRRSLGGGLELWAGFFESVRPGENTYFVNVKRAHTVFYEKKDLVSFLCEHFNMRDLPVNFDSKQRDRINDVLEKVKVRPLHRPNIKTGRPIKCLSLKKAKEHEFQLHDTDEKTNVLKYFSDTYNIKLKYQHVVEIGSGREVWPIECCEIIQGQKFSNKKLSGVQTAKVITFTALLPKKNIETLLNEGVRGILNFGKDPKLKEFGMEIGDNMTEIPGRILSPPTISFHSSSKEGEKLNPKNGQWNLRGRKFKECSVLNSWFVISCVEEKFLPMKDIERFVVNLVKTFKVQGMKVTMEEPKIVYPSIQGDFQKTIQRECKNSSTYLSQPLQLILFLLPPEVDKKNSKKKAFPREIYDRKLNQQLYKDIKFTTQTVLGVSSQCLVADNVYEGPSYCANVAMKMNNKLQGVNFSTLDDNQPLPLNQKPIMFLGADVTHSPSICCVVGSVDLHGNVFTERHREQKKIREGTNEIKNNSAEEKILDMREMVADILKEYKKRNRFLPAQIIMYRDGVSESQYKMALEYELREIQAACQDMKESGYSPPVTYIVVGKRHHTQLFPHNQRDGDSKGNFLPGLVIEDTICHRYMFDYFLLSHSSLHGTSRPSKYVVLYDDNKFTPDQLQSISYRLCHNYQRSTRSISIPSPVYYAHLAAKNARLHFNRNGKLMPVAANLAQNKLMYY